MTTNTSKTPSPEETGIYKCSLCGNTQQFTGIDAHGYGGPDACDGGKDCRNGECYCETELRQDFLVIEHGPEGYIEYAAFTGGEGDSEIGSYTTIICRDCGHTIWTEA
jgi:DNA-directed RNA polymerase subunit RPC12/RpoP